MFNPYKELKDEQLKKGIEVLRMELENGTITEDRKISLIEIAKELKRRGYELVA